MRSYVGSVSLIVLLCCGPSCRMPGMGCDQPNSRNVQITATGDPIVTPGMFTFRIVVPQWSQWSTCFAVETSIGGRRIKLRHRCGEPIDTSAPAQRLQAWRLSNPLITTGDSAFDCSLEVGARDLGSLQIEDPAQPDCPILAAGAPWFMTLFGRDSLLTAWMTLGLDPRLALNTLRRLGRVKPLQRATAYRSADRSPAVHHGKGHGRW